MSDVNMSGTITPAKIDKAFRYHKGACSARKHVSGKGEIRPHRDVGPTELTRRRKRSERSNYAWRQSQDSDDDSDDSFSTRSRHRPRHRNNRKPQPHGGVVASVLRMMEENHTAPENLHRWIQLGINIFLGLIFCGVVASIVRAVHSDIAAVNEAARQDIRAKAARCRNDYIVNHCATTDAPAIKELCNKWFDCMSHNPDSIVRVRATMTEIANIMNDFFGHLNLKAWVSRTI